MGICAGSKNAILHFPHSLKGFLVCSQGKAGSYSAKRQMGTGKKFWIYEHCMWNEYMSSEDLHGKISEQKNYEECAQVVGIRMVYDGRRAAAQTPRSHENPKAQPTQHPSSSNCVAMDSCKYCRLNYKRSNSQFQVFQSFSRKNVTDIVMNRRSIIIKEKWNKLDDWAIVFIGREGEKQNKTKQDIQPSNACFGCRSLPYNAWSAAEDRLC